MNVISNLGKRYVASAAFVLVAHLATQAQNPVESTHVDEKYAYTTVVYKNKAANDQEVLNMLNNDSSFGIGDVVRITVAPPPSAAQVPVTPISASEPVYADKNKGEDTWLNPTRQTTPLRLTASASPLAPEAKTAAVASSTPAGKPMPAAILHLVGKPAMAVKPAPATMPETLAAAPATATETKAAIDAPTSTTTVKTRVSTSEKSGKTHKSVKKNAKKKGVFKLQLKSRKPGKQRYSCPRF